MDRVISARLDTRIVEKLERASKQLGITKRQFLEDAISQKAEAAEGDSQARRRDFEGALRASFGAWRDLPGTTEEIIEDIRTRWGRAFSREERREPPDR